MWIKPPPNKLEPSGQSNLNFVYNNDKIFVMDNHLAAAWCWLQKINVNRKYNFYHIDRHYDLVNCPSCVQNNVINKGIDIASIKLTDYLLLRHYTNANDKTPLFRFDNYIRNLEVVYPEIYNLKYFATHKDEGVQKYIYDDDKAYEIEDYEVVRQIKSDIQGSTNQWIVNIDLDYFFLDKEGEYYQHLSDQYILELFRNIKNAYADIAVITIALSPENCGGWDNSYRKARMITEFLGIDFRLPSLWYFN